MVFPNDQQQSTDNEAASNRKAALLRKAKIRYLYLHHSPYSANTEYTLPLLFCSFFAGVTFPSILSSPYFLLFISGIFLISFGSFSRYVSRIWPLILLYSFLHIAFIFVYQFPQISSRIVGEESLGSGFCTHYIAKNETNDAELWAGVEEVTGAVSEGFIYTCEVPTGLAGLFGLYRYTCFNSNVQNSWYYPFGYLFIVLVFYILCLLKHKRDVFSQLTSEGLKVPHSSRVTPGLVRRLDISRGRRKRREREKRVEEEFGTRGRARKESKKRLC